MANASLTCCNEKLADVLMSQKITLDEVQLEAAKAIYSAARCKHSRSIHVISGAHGTGKTKIVFSAVASLFSK